MTLKTDYRLEAVCGEATIVQDELRNTYGAVFAAAKPAGLRVATRAVPLAEMESVWTQAEDARRMVFIP